MTILVDSVKDALSHTGTARTDQDNIMIELVLTLFRNLLAVRDGSRAASLAATLPHTT